MWTWNTAFLYSPNEKLDPRNGHAHKFEDQDGDAKIVDVKKPDTNKEETGNNTNAGQDEKKASTSSLATPETSEWSDETDVHEFPTNAFGTIDFLNEDEGSDKPSK